MGNSGAGGTESRRESVVSGEYAAVHQAAQLVSAKKVVLKFMWLFVELVCK
jgi:hypothetical protein